MQGEVLLTQRDKLRFEFAAHDVTPAIRAFNAGRADAPERIDDGAAFCQRADREEVVVNLNEETPSRFGRANLMREGFGYD